MRPTPCLEEPVYREQVMTPEHPRWSEFVSILSHVQVCLGTTAHTRMALASFPGIDVEESVRALAALGGKCDCEIEHDIAPLLQSASSG